jgi:hypothetical protein
VGGGRDQPSFIEDQIKKTGRRSAVSLAAAGRPSRETGIEAGAGTSWRRLPPVVRCPVRTVVAVSCARVAAGSSTGSPPRVVMGDG